MADLLGDEPAKKGKRPAKKKAADSEKPHYHGHRQRLRSRLIETGGDGMADYEILELILCMALPQKDMKPLAKELLKRFGSFAGVVSADPERLMEVNGIKETGLAALKAIRAAAVRLAKADLSELPVIASWDRLIDYCRASMGHDLKESFRILFLDRKNRLIADEVQQRGTVDHTPLYPREVVKRALDLGASALILVHNHPSGDATPSKDDIAMTRMVKEAAAKLGILVHDHVVVSKREAASFKTMGLL
jgi:DNA repair protein RadC